ncbi:hypothetical protein JJL56_02030 [Azospirillum sp. YIM DDC1]|nr:hypothetical protein [Azospirillum aestuarii]MBK4717638.1 hypothetical protein [Azospirillum aestuarii]
MSEIREILRTMIWTDSLPDHAWPRPSDQAYRQEMMRLRSLLEAAPEDTELEPLSSMVLAVEVGSEAYMDALTAVSDALGSELGRAPQ